MTAIKRNSTALHFSTADFRLVMGREGRSGAALDSFALAPFFVLAIFCLKNKKKPPPPFFLFGSERGGGGKNM